MKFNLEQAIALLERTPSIVRTLLSGLPEASITKNEGPDTWSPYDVVGHLVHGERTDWIPRLFIIMNDSDQKTFEPYDRFAQFEESKGMTLDDLLQEFETLRKQNIEQLKDFGLTETEFKREGIHPSLGPVTLANLLSAWVVHDQGHIAQISRVLAKQYKDEVGPWTKYMTILKYAPKE
ncbi:MAG: DinB family protein [Bacteroidia bacterium]|nr:DinB family protein [Bacteroidia bacterium]NNF30700.1 DinB family protein [Flavobacteriaceae bacterium]MBT8277255.1 DinB family protein [Bacteroidia bacterium]NNJ80780.1 DinB family protein [Flavobacteriaceae bacterium]NNK54855.1 DinB family protein [Flavobacteriaceae bacterium]